MAITTFKTWAVYPKAFLQARRVAALSKTWPKHEQFALTDQIKRSSRAVCANLAESYSKRRYPKHFVAKITDSAGENAETQVWLDFALEEGFLSVKQHQQLMAESIEIGKLLTYMEYNPERYKPKEGNGQSSSLKATEL